MENKRVGIITFHASENFGSALQAFALQHVLKQNHYESELIDFILESDMIQYKIFRTNFYKKNPKAFIADLLYFRRNQKRKSSFREFRKNYLKVSSSRYYAGKADLTALNESYDILICGSDQIWNLNCTGRMVPEFFLSFADDAKRKIAYAPSMPKDIEPQYFSELRKYIGRLDFVSVRERQTVDYLKKVVGVKNDVRQVLDPTLLIHAEEYIKEFHLKKSDEKYIFIYILDAGNFDRAIIKQTYGIAKQKKLKIKYVSTRYIKELFGAEYCLGMGPKEFLEAVYNAAYVITDSFHATVFSIQFSTPFCVFPRKNSESRMVDLLDMLDMKDSLYSQDKGIQIDSRANEDAGSKLRPAVQESLSFLLKALHIPMN